MQVELRHRDLNVKLMLDSLMEHYIKVKYIGENNHEDKMLKKLTINNLQ